MSSDSGLEIVVCGRRPELPRAQLTRVVAAHPRSACRHVVEKQIGATILASLLQRRGTYHPLVPTGNGSPRRLWHDAAFGGDQRARRGPEAGDLRRAGRPPVLAAAVGPKPAARRRAPRRATAGRGADGVPAAASRGHGTDSPRTIADAITPAGQATLQLGLASRQRGVLPNRAADIFAACRTALRCLSIHSLGAWPQGPNTQPHGRNNFSRRREMLRRVPLRRVIRCRGRRKRLPTPTNRRFRTIH